MFAELLCRSSFSFCEGASSPEELVEQAAELGLSAIGLVDRDGVYGLPRAWRHLEDLRRADPDRALPQLVCGARVTVEGGPGLSLLVQNKAGWSALCRLLTRARCAGTLHDSPTEAPHGRAGLEKGRARVPLALVLQAGKAGGLDAIAMGNWEVSQLQQLAHAFPGRVSIALPRYLDGA